MTFSEIAAELRVALRDSVEADKGVSVEERTFFTTLASALDEEIIALWLSLSHLKDHHVSTIVAKRWAKEANDFSEWIAALGMEYRSTE